MVRFELVSKRWPAFPWALLGREKREQNDKDYRQSKQVGHGEEANLLGVEARNGQSWKHDFEILTVSWKWQEINENFSQESAWHN